MTVYRGSRYTNTSVSFRNGDGMILNTRIRNNYSVDKMSYYTVKDGDTLDYIAFKAYGKPSLYWAILDANRNLTTELDVIPGIVLAIPSYEEVVKSIE